MDELVATCMTQIRAVINRGEVGKFTVTTEYLEENLIRADDFIKALGGKAADEQILVNVERVWDEFEVQFQPFKKRSV